jgi:hypothetical protein
VIFFSPSGQMFDIFHPRPFQFVTGYFLIIRRYINCTTEKCVKRIVTDLLKALPGNSSVNTVQHATMQEPVFSMRCHATMEEAAVSMR